MGVGLCSLRCVVTSGSRHKVLKKNTLNDVKRPLKWGNSDRGCPNGAAFLNLDKSKSWRNFLDEKRNIFRTRKSSCRLKKHLWDKCHGCNPNKSGTSLEPHWHCQNQCKRQPYWTLTSCDNTFNTIKQEHPPSPWKGLDKWIKMSNSIQTFATNHNNDSLFNGSFPKGDNYILFGKCTLYPTHPEYSKQLTPESLSERGFFNECFLLDAGSKRQKLVNPTKNCLMAGDIANSQIRDLLAKQPKHDCFVCMAFGRLEQVALGGGSIVTVAKQGLSLTLM